ncbi:hypothetical protein F5X99DRAFT_416988 [Biscogniauxia marginata]|nr:hypothetical protein F5X99DRAFT_416988 [Biscogniauxia marginata]
MDLNPVLSVLGIESLDNLSFDDLKDKIGYAASIEMSRPQTLGTMMGWLHEQIKKDAVTQQTSLLQKFVNLLIMPDGLGIAPFRETEIDLAFKAWQEKDGKENPANRRRYLMAKVDMHELLAQAMSGYQSENIPSSSGSSRRPGRKERQALLCETTASLFLSGSKDKDSKQEWFQVGKKKTGANVIPLGTRKQPMRLASTQEVVEPDDDDEPAQQADTSASYGSDINEVNVTRESTVLDSSPETMTKKLDRRNTQKARHGRKHNASTSSDFSQPPSVNYVCNRCSEPGHWIQLCPTNLDPSYDRPPEPNYRCELCGQVGAHFATLCPRNENEFSLTKQRQRMAAGSKTPIWGDDYQRRSSSPTDRYHRGGHDIYRPERSPRVRYEESNRRARRMEDRRELSPYSARLRLTREWEWERERRGASPRRSTSDNYHPLDRSSPSPHFRRDLENPPTRSSRRRKNSDKPRDEGRLAYDDDIDVFIEPDLSLQVPQKKNAPKHIEAIREDDDMMDAPPIVNDTPEDIEEAKREADRFLDALGIELMSTAMFETLEDPVYMDEARSESNEYNDVIKVDPFIFQKLDGTKVRIVQESQFQPKVVALFANRENPIIHSKANRKTACQMMMNTSYPPKRGREKYVGGSRAS